MENSKIEWTHHTYNPWWGCLKVSAGCEHCYAETFSKRTGHNIWGPAKTTDRRLFGAKHWAEPLKWDKAAEKAGERHRVFCASMADVFEDHPQVVDARHQLFELIEQTPHLDWLLLTKRPENIQRLWPFGWYDDQFTWPNVWIGTSVEDQAAANKRIPELLKVPAQVRFLSCEPLLEGINISGYLQHGRVFDTVSAWGGSYERVPRPIHWVICGGESGHHARPMQPNWARSLRDQCRAAGVAFLFKQHGEYIARSQLTSQQLADLPKSAYVNAKPIDGDQVYRVGKHAAGRLLDGQEWNQFPLAVTA